MNFIQNHKSDTGSDMRFHKNDARFRWKDKNIVDNSVETGDFLKTPEHKCHF